jgi:carboxyl-terminal processing protease
MPTPPREPSLDWKAIAALTVSLLLVLVAGIWLGGHPDDLPSFARNAFVADHSTRVVDEAIGRISSDYYRPVEKGRLAGASIAGAVASLHDRFSHYLTPREVREFNAPPSFTGIGVDVGGTHAGLLVVRVFDSTPASRSHLKPGDLIVSVNGRALAGVPERAATEMIKGPPGTDVVIGIRRGSRGRAVPVRITRATISVPVVASVVKTVDKKKLGVVGLATFSPGAHSEVRAAVERVLRGGARGIVLDLRGNGGGLVEEARLIASVFVRRGTIVTTRARSQPAQVITASGAAIAGSVPLAVLVDHHTASASEIVAAALQDHHRATIVGTHTFGKGVFQEEEVLANGGAIEITVGEYFTPNGRNLGGGGVKQGAGVIPEVLVQRGVDARRGLEVALRTLAAKVS